MATQVFDSVSVSMLVFGGIAYNNESFSYAGDLWNYSLVTDSWTQLAPPGPYPSPEGREDHSAVWDISSRSMIVYAGFNSTYKNDVWRYAGPEVQAALIAYCSRGQWCEMRFEDFEPGDRLSVSKECGSARVFGLPEPGFAETLDGINFSFVVDVQDFAVSDSAADAFMFAEPGAYRICACEHTSVPCNSSQDFAIAVGTLVVAGPHLGQSFQCQLGSECIVSGLQGARLFPDDRLVAMRLCGTLQQAPAFEHLPPVLAVYNQTADELLFDFGYVDLEDTAPEIVQLCWCAADDNCESVEAFRALAMQLHLVCPPGWYELSGNMRRCQPCPPGSYCPGGTAAESKPCMFASTSPAMAPDADLCKCRRGYFWDVQVGACSECPAGYFKASVGNALCQLCPANSTSTPGAIAERECFCKDGMIDVDPSPSITCIEAATLAGNSTVSDPVFAATVAFSFQFNGSMLAAGVSPPLSEVQTAVEGYLSFSSRSVLKLELQNGNEIRYLFASSEKEEADRMHALFHKMAFAAWALAEMSSTSMASLEVASRSPVQVQELHCQHGQGFAEGARITTDADCQCAHGLEPTSLASTSTCEPCPVGRYKAVVGTVACSSCFTLTTQHRGAVSIFACKCPPGYFNNADADPTSCAFCGQGFFCAGGSNRQSCDVSSETTYSDTSAEAADCVCAKGFSRVGDRCEACAPGRFKHEPGDKPCSDCPQGTWSDVVGSESLEMCEACEKGSTTEKPGAASESFCMRPEGGQRVKCVAGRACQIRLRGYSLQEGHRMALSAGPCPPSSHSVPSISNNGISEPAAGGGTVYSWGQGPSDFTPEGGFYTMCWCASVANLLCPDDGSGFVISAGVMTVAGPLRSNFVECVRGHDCRSLFPFNGTNLSDENGVSVRLGSCGRSSSLKLSLKNIHGTGWLENGTVGEHVLSFGTSLTAARDYGLSIDASFGYILCWCERSCNQPEDFIVDAGQLRVSGPITNQEKHCYRGQPCLLKHIDAWVVFQNTLYPDCSVLRFCQECG